VKVNAGFECDPAGDDDELQCLRSRLALSDPLGDDELQCLRSRLALSEATLATLVSKSSDSFELFLSTLFII